eukprot:GHVU01047320.1.p2 GENE.GHVU01047320.1~~GHVU01047320.1.p2  ORF type:complete len:113 (-),score=9.51 GHVU01047320.1:470-808(-)
MYQEFVDVVNNEEFKTRLRQAATDPDGDDAKRIVSIIHPHLCIVGGDIPFHLSALKTATNGAYAMLRAYGMPSVFATLAPDDVQDLRAMTNVSTVRTRPLTHNNRSYVGVCA